MPRPTHQHRNAEVDFRGKKRPGAPHASTPDPDARLCKPPAGAAAMPCFRHETRPGESPICATPAARPMSPGNRDIPPSTAGPPGTRAMPCPSATARRSRPPSAGPRPRAAGRRPCLAALSG
jgi:hypothetical protein